MNPFRNLLFRGGTIMLAASVPLSTMAQIEEVVVTAQRREASAQETPIAINALSGDQLDDYGIVGADDLETDLPGTRVLCLRSRWTVTPAEAAGMVTILQETMSDPRPPFGLTGLVTSETARVMHGMLTDLRTQLANAEQREDPDLSSWPLLSERLPDVSAQFAACHLAR